MRLSAEYFEFRHCRYLPHRTTSQQGHRSNFGIGARSKPRILGCLEIEGVVGNSISACLGERSERGLDCVWSNKFLCEKEAIGALASFVQCNCKSTIHYQCCESSALRLNIGFLNRINEQEPH